jgi:Na+/H+ antiporter NhaD/arsenite permease-like protein
MHAAVDGAALGAWWAVPFVGMLLSIALLPLLAAPLWHAHFGKIAAAWALAFVLPYAFAHGAAPTGGLLVHTLLAEYAPFVILLTALYTISGGIYLRGNLHGSPGLNAALIGTGAVLASLMGTTGAAMLMIRPLIRANDARPSAAHVMIFFIFIVANAGGALTPLGDPPLFLGFLQGVEFTWTLRQLWPQTLFLIGTLLVLFVIVDRWHWRRDGPLRADPTPDTHPGLRIVGLINLVPLAGVVALVLLSGTWKSDVAFDIAGTNLALPQLVRDGGLIALTLISLAVTPRGVHQSNEFSWGPMQEVAKLFAGIFVTMLPVLAMLRAGTSGAFAGVLHAVTGADGQPLPGAYFWLSGALSSFLDNAPTYLVFFNMAGGDPQHLMTALAPTLAALSAGSVFMGANTYIGNAPNFMVKAIAEHRGIRMPGFFGYMLWSGIILLPLFLLISLIWFR